MPHNFQNDFNAYIHEKYPTVNARSLLIGENLISPFVFQISKETLAQAQSVADAAFELRNLTAYQTHVRDQYSQETAKFDPKNYSVFMSFDFHTTEQGLKLIEINTNAAFSLVAWELHNFKNIDSAGSIHSGYDLKIRTAFEDEAKLALGRATPRSIAIVDDTPESQKMFVEFVMFKDLFESWGWKTAILDVSQAVYRDGRLLSPDGEEFDFVYYRSTDFLIENSRALRDAYLNRKACFSPNPNEYLLLAEKSRLTDMTDPNLLRSFGLAEKHIQTFQARLPFIHEAKKFSEEELWALRKKVFFKPKQAYAGKQVYSGASVTRKVFEQIRAGDFVAQEAIPAPVLPMRLPSGETENFKYDLRFYAYRNEIHLATARFYQGQVTNFRAPGSGFAAVEIK